MKFSIAPKVRSVEALRLREGDGVYNSPWRRFGPYLSERQWGTVREDYSEGGSAWEYFPHDHARSRAYRWGEDGLAGFSDHRQRLWLSLALWNERLCSGLQQPGLMALLRSIALALPRVGFQHARRHRRDSELPEDARQELEKSTTTLAKTLHWVSRLLCVPVSELYVLPEVSGSLGLMPGADRPLVTCARLLGSGFSLPELVLFP